MKKYKNQAGLPAAVPLSGTKTGQSLLEVLVGLAVGSLLIGAAAFAISAILQANMKLQRSQSASGLNQEIMDRVRAFASGDWQNLASLTKGATTTYFLSASGSASFAILGREGVEDGGVTAGLVGLWKFDESTSTATTTLFDSGGNNLSGTLASGGSRPAAPCVLGNCLIFDGTANGYATLSASPLLNTAAFTVAFWARPVTFRAGDENQNIIMARQTAGTNGFRMGLKTSGLPVFITPQAGGISLAGTVALSTFSFTHIAVTFSSGTATLYENGISAAAASSTYVVPSGVALTVNGGVSGAGFANTQTDDVRYYNRALSAAEVRRLAGGNTFTRYFTVESVCRMTDAGGQVARVAPCGVGNANDPSTLFVTAMTRWQSGITTGYVQSGDYVTRWENSVLRQADWSGGGNVSGPLTESSNGFATSSGIDVAPGGGLRVHGM